MKAIKLLSLGMLGSMLLLACKPDLQVTYRYKGIKEGYDHNCRTEVFVDGEKVATSATHKESQPQLLRINTKLSKGTHAVRVVNSAFYEGKWEEHLVRNGYGLDAEYAGDLQFKARKRRINLVFDIDGQQTYSTVK